MIEKHACDGIGLPENRKLYRDGNGVLTETLEEIKNLTRNMADSYYIHGREYIIDGMLFTYSRTWDKAANSELVEMGRFNHGDYNIFVDPRSLGTFLPDVASVGQEIVAVDDERFQPLPYLTKSLKKHVMRIINKKGRS